MNVLVCLVFSHSVVIVHRITVVKRVKQMIENRKVTANQLNNGCRVKNCAFWSIYSIRFDYIPKTRSLEKRSITALLEFRSWTTNTNQSINYLHNSTLRWQDKIYPLYPWYTGWIPIDAFRLIASLALNRNLSVWN